MADTLTFEHGLCSLLAFYKSAQDPSLAIGDTFPYGTHTVAKPGETKNEPGRRHHKNSANQKNVQQAQEWVKKHSLVITSDGFIAKVKDALLRDFGQEALTQAEETHRQKFRLVEGIAAYIAECCDWGHHLVKMMTTRNLDEVAGFPKMWDQRENFVIPAAYFKGGKLNLTSGVAVKNEKAQDHAIGKVVIQVNASAGSSDQLEAGGGVFGDPCYSLTTQEENLYRTFPFELKIFVRFFLGTYSEAVTPIRSLGGQSTDCLPKEVISRFTYHPQFAPGQGRCLALPVEDITYIFSAANDNTKVPMSEEQQEALAFRVTCNILGTAEKHRIHKVVLGAWVKIP